MLLGVQTTAGTWRHTSLTTAGHRKSCGTFRGLKDCILDLGVVLVTQGEDESVKLSRCYIQENPGYAKTGKQCKHLRSLRSISSSIRASLTGRRAVVIILLSWSTIVPASTTFVTNHSSIGSCRLSCHHHVKSSVSPSVSRLSFYAHGRGHRLRHSPRFSLFLCFTSPNSLVDSPLRRHRTGAMSPEQRLHPGLSPHARRMPLATPP